MAGDGDKFFNISGGWQWKNTVNAVVGLEFEGKYNNAYELYIDLATAYDKCPVCNKVCSDSFWSCLLYTSSNVHCQETQST